MKFLISILFFIFSLNSFSKVSQLVSITSDVDKNLSKLSMDTKEDGEILSMRILTVGPSGQTVSDETYQLAEVRTGSVVLAERSGEDVIVLSAPDVDPFTGGKVNLNYLFNALSGVRKNIFLDLKKGHGEFALYNQAGIKITRMFVKGNRSGILGVIGIREIIECDANPQSC